MLRYMLDTDTCITVLRDRPEPLREKFNSEAEALCISTVTLAELLYGAAKSSKPVDNRREVERFADRLTVLGFDSTAAAHAAEIRASLERKGLTIGAYDLLIAGHGRSRGLAVVTGNTREFRRVDGLRSEKWVGK